MPNGKWYPPQPKKNAWLKNESDMAVLVDSAKPAGIRLFYWHHPFKDYCTDAQTRWHPKKYQGANWRELLRSDYLTVENHPTDSDDGILRITDKGRAFLAAQAEAQS